MVPAAVPGVWVPLRQVADLTPDWTPAVITHYNGVPTVTVSSELREGASQPVAMKKIQKYVEEDFRKTLPEGVEIAALVRDTDDIEEPEVLIAQKDVVVEPEDRVIVFVPGKRVIPQVEKLFAVDVGFF